jgi:hypothetical protein
MRSKWGQEAYPLAVCTKKPGTRNTDGVERDFRGEQIQKPHPPNGGECGTREKNQTTKTKDQLLRRCLSFVPQDKPFVPQDNPFVPQDEPFVPQDKPFVPQDRRNCLRQRGQIPSEKGYFMLLK